MRRDEQTATCSPPVAELGLKPGMATAWLDAPEGVADTLGWIAWPKRASGVPTSSTEDVVRELALPLGLVDVKVRATRSGLKLVIRKELR